MDFILKGLEWLASAIWRLVSTVDGLIRIGGIVVTLVGPLFEEYEKRPTVLAQFDQWGGSASEVSFS